MPDPAITIDRLQPFQVALHVPAQIALDLDFIVRDGVDDLVDLLWTKILRAQVRIDVCLLEDALRHARADPVNVSERGFDAFVRWNFNSE